MKPPSCNTGVKSLQGGAFDEGAFVDWLRLTFDDSLDVDLLWQALFECFGAAPIFEPRDRGIFNFDQSAEVRLNGARVGLFAFGGEHQRGRAMLELSGDGCGRVRSWTPLIALVENFRAKITRLDVAVDFNRPGMFEAAVAAFHLGAFAGQGRPPHGKVIDDLGSGAGRTLYVGSRECATFFRGYEKGKQLCAATSDWFRCEVEWRNRHREIPVDAIRQPGKYFAGAYRAFESHSLEQRVIKTVAHIAQAHIEKATEHARKQAGRVIHGLLTLGLKVEEVMARLHVPELPKKLAAPIRAFLALDESERTYTPATAPTWAAKATPEEVADLYKAFRLQRAPWRVGQGTNGTNPLAGNAAPAWAPFVAA